MPRIYDTVGVNLNKGTKRVNSVAPGCTIEYEADIPDEERDRRVRRPAKRSAARKAIEKEILEFKRQRESIGYRVDTEIKGINGATVKITSMADKDLNNWNAPPKQQTGEVPDGFTIAPAYNKGAYQIVPRDDTDAYTDRK